MSANKSSGTSRVNATNHPNQARPQHKAIANLKASQPNSAAKKTTRFVTVPGEPVLPSEDLSDVPLSSRGPEKPTEVFHNRIGSRALVPGDHSWKFGYRAKGAPNSAWERIGLRNAEFLAMSREEREMVQERKKREKEEKEKEKKKEERRKEIRRGLDAKYAEPVKATKVAVAATSEELPAGWTQEHQDLADQLAASFAEDEQAMNGADADVTCDAAKEVEGAKASAISAVNTVGAEQKTATEAVTASAAVERTLKRPKLRISLKSKRSDQPAANDLPIVSEASATAGASSPPATTPIVSAVSAETVNTITPALEVTPTILEAAAAIPAAATTITANALDPSESQEITPPSSSEKDKHKKLSLAEDSKRKRTRNESSEEAPAVKKARSDDIATQLPSPDTSMDHFISGNAGISFSKVDNSPAAVRLRKIEQRKLEREAERARQAEEEKRKIEKFKKQCFMSKPKADQRRHLHGWKPKAKKAEAVASSSGQEKPAEEVNEGDAQRGPDEQKIAKGASGIGHQSERSTGASIPTEQRNELAGVGNPTGQPSVHDVDKVTPPMLNAKRKRNTIDDGKVEKAKRNRTSDADEEHEDVSTRTKDSNDITDRNKQITKDASKVLITEHSNVDTTKHIEKAEAPAQFDATPKVINNVQEVNTCTSDGINRTETEEASPQLNATLEVVNKDQEVRTFNTKRKCDANDDDGDGDDVPSRPSSKRAHKIVTPAKSTPVRRSKRLTPGKKQS